MALPGSAALRRIRCSEEDPTFIGSGSQRIQLSEALLLGEEPSSKRRVQCLEDPTLRGSSSQEDQTWRSIWLLEDLALREGSGAHRIQLLEDPVLEGSNSRRRIGHSEDPAFGRYNSWRTQLSESPSLGVPGSWRKIQCSPH